MDAPFVEAVAKNLSKPLVLTVNRIERLLRPSGAGQWELQDVPTPDPIPAPLQVSSLTGLVDYLDANRDGLELGNSVVVHVENPQIVRVLGPLTKGFRQRECYLVASPTGHCFQFGTYYDHESFVIALQTRFEKDETREKLLQLVASIKSEAVNESKDDGVTQVVTARAGVALAKEIELPNPVTLRPFRTFREVEQPASLFVLRAKRGPEDGKPSIALFEADGGAWQLEAIRNVADHLKKLVKVPVLA